MAPDDGTSARHSSSRSLLATGAEIFSCCFGFEHLGPAGAASAPSPCSPHGEKGSIPWDQSSALLWIREMCDLGVAEGTAGLGGRRGIPGIPNGTQFLGGEGGVGDAQQ